MHYVPEVEQALRELTHLEQEFCQWFENGGYADFKEKIKDSDSRDLLMKEEIEDNWMGTVYPNAYQKWCEFSQKWILDACSSSPKAEELIDFIITIRCVDPEELRKAQFIAGMRYIGDLRIGESDFGGTLCGYTIHVGSCGCLESDVSPSQPDNTSLLSNWVMAIDCSEIDLRVQSPGQENRHSGGESVSRTRTRSTTIDELLDYSPFCFLQIGNVRYCTGESWVQLRNDEASVAAEPLRMNRFVWEGTNYHVVVQLDAGGYPVGAVYMVYSHQFESSL